MKCWELNLFWILNKTKTTVWKRFLRDNILRSLKDKEAIKTRLDFVRSFLKDKILLDKIRDKLSYIAYIDAILNRLLLNRVSLCDLLNLKIFLQAFLETFEIIKKDESEKLKKY